MAAADLGLFFIKPVFSKQASSPTKMGEMLALGLPIVTNAGVGDVAEIVAATGCGAAIPRFDREAYDAAIDTVEAMTAAPAELRRRALPWFDVELGIERYDAIYRALVAR
jgi:glycosyltransferase involved in cell wall biosynthesis